MVIFETVMSIGHKTQKESYPCQEDLRILYFIYLFIIFYYYYFFSQNVSSGSFPRLLHLHEKFIKIIIITTLFQEDTIYLV